MRPPRPLMAWAAQRGNLHKIRRTLQYRQARWCFDPRLGAPTWSALHIAVRCNQLHAARLLVELGADVNLHDPRRGPPINQVRSVEAVRLLVSLGATISMDPVLYVLPHATKLSGVCTQSSDNLILQLLPAVPRPYCFLVAARPPSAGHKDRGHRARADRPWSGHTARIG